LAAHAHASPDSEWDLVSRCESGGNWAINTGNGFHGGLQFTTATWNSFGGGQYAAEAERATKEQQIAIAERVLAGQGHGAWPVCGSPLAGARPRQVPAATSAAVDGPPTTSNPNDGAVQPVNIHSADDPAPVAVPDPPAAVERSPKVTGAASADQVAVIDTPSEAQSQALDAVPVTDAAPAADEVRAPEVRADSGAPQEAVLLPPADHDSSDSLPGSQAQLVQAAANVPGYDADKEAALVALIHRYSGTPYIWGGDSAAGTDCSGLASWLANAATGRQIFGDRFDTSSEESALLARGFRYGTAPWALVVGWNNHHTAVTLPDGTPVASGEGGGVGFGGGGAYQAQFDHHMYLPISPGPVDAQPAHDPSEADHADL
jgi:cell wall-associated NlpC family hydrolase